MIRDDRTRASDSERERVVGWLRDAAAQGRITVEELDERCERAYAALTRGELAALIEDLPVPRAAAPARHSAPAPPPPPPRYTPPPSGLREWLPGRQAFEIMWYGPPDPRAAGEQILEHIVPIFTAAGYDIVERTANSLVLREVVSPLESLAALAGLMQGAGTVMITMTARSDRSVVDVRGWCSQDIRRALARFTR